ncbi:hypothetical protein CEUSTIGMA_g1045.t1 [Chlamydomonas eustigma]|uniref:Acyl-[acyl-carrier-protein] hydrolase n=1 Tax=Chlamydomonas eustigma TaxID=1157962 RepID=A0A250WRX1_9CHLO|nr:hypothetical protein CEUSTIGMA_g1045.t1 [Chlamydomonas eustigma]|eukprot:GAX73594.1 hypothetical protein CEUSTIGMA_g1045.t1 [Chlamydomonas eustigma]
MKLVTVSYPLNRSGLCLQHSHSLICRRSLAQRRYLNTLHAVESSDIVKVAVSQFPSAAPGRFINDNTAFVQQFPVRGYEVAPNQRASMVTIANLLQELAGNHAVGMWGRAEEGFASLPNAPDIIFVMTRLQIRMNEYPKWGDILELQTYFTDDGRLAARRDWLISDTASGKQIGSATSTWVNINMRTRKLTKLPEDLKIHFMRFADPQGRMSIPVEETKKKIPDLDADLQVEGPSQVARRSDMDMNSHINNVVYLGWGLESVPVDVYDGYELYEMEVDFKAECQAGDTVKSLIQPITHNSGSPEGNGASGTKHFLHMLLKDGSSTHASSELVRARTSWKKQVEL